MQIIRSISEMQKQAEAWRKLGKRIGFVPTMGFLHEGHLHLVSLSRQKTDFTVASIFVNPTQFGPQEDFSRYPRDEEGDLKKLEEAGTDLVFLPTAEEMYPEGFQTSVHLKQITQGLCGQSRPGHFDGVATVVLKLFQLVKPHAAIFGEKDYQQLTVIRRMVKDLNLDVEIVGAPTQRSPEGLALSSRNSYLTEEEKKKALSLSQVLQAIMTAFQKGERRVSELLQEGKNLLEKTEGIDLEYLEIVDASTLSPLKILNRPARALIAAKIGKTRLIDNVALGDFS
ncbi:MAG: pantoate--beta-alanine ligase [bacterium]